MRIDTGAPGLVGGTPLVRLTRVVEEDMAEVYAKCELANPSGSVKDRAALAMIREAEADGRLKPGMTVVEPTSGNTGIALAMIAAVRGYRCKLVMPDDMSVGRRYLLAAYGAELVLTRALEGMQGAVEEARAIARREGAFMPQQFENPANPRAHEETTGPEIFEDLEGRLDVFVAGIGTGGTFTGVGRYLRKQGSTARLVAVEPARSAVLSGGSPGLHGIQGLGAGFVPPVLDRSLIDEVVTVTDTEAHRMAERLAKEEGLLVGPSSGANVHVALHFAQRLGPGHRVVTVLCDGGERYLIS
ncbi:MAG: cysteine synthase A [Deltaproteobacteria bacterium]|nr:MAG: cysteine synthase A [Deltaproteobacteria bacterium]